MRAALPASAAPAPVSLAPPRPRPPAHRDRRSAGTALAGSHRRCTALSPPGPRCRAARPSARPPATRPQVGPPRTARFLPEQAPIGCAAFIPGRGAEGAGRPAVITLRLVRGRSCLRIPGGSWLGTGRWLRGVRAAGRGQECVACWREAGRDRTAAGGGPGGRRVERRSGRADEETPIEVDEPLNEAAHDLEQQSG